MKTGTVQIIGSIRHNLSDWYAANQRTLPWRRADDPYHIWVSETTLQQTQVATVIPYYDRFLKRFPAVQDLAEAPLQDVLKLWEGLGYYARARNLHKAAGIVVSQYDSLIPADWDAFIGLPGVGSYIAAAVLSIAFDQPYAVVDGNVKRVLARLWASDTPVNTPQSHGHYQKLADKLLDRKQAGTFNQAVMELGALVCRPGNPECGVCPLSTLCRSYNEGRVDQFPVRVKRKSVPVYCLAAGVVCKNGRVLIVRRPESGLLGGLWEFPGGVVEKGEDAEAACGRLLKETVGLGVSVRATLGRVKHAYTHFKVEADILICDYEAGRVRLSGPEQFQWVTPKGLSRYPFTGMTRKFLPALAEALD